MFAESFSKIQLTEVFISTDVEERGMLFECITFCLNGLSTSL